MPCVMRLTRPLDDSAQGGAPPALLLFAAVMLGLGFCGYGWALLRSYSAALARKTFRFSLIHLRLLFAALRVDHYTA